LYLCTSKAAGKIEYLQAPAGLPTRAHSPPPPLQRRASSRTRPARAAPSAAPCRLVYMLPHARARARMLWHPQLLGARGPLPCI
jgi:hypothetical protein